MIRIKIRGRKWHFEENVITVACRLHCLHRSPGEQTASEHYPDRVGGDPHAGPGASCGRWLTILMAKPLIKNEMGTRVADQEAVSMEPNTFTKADAIALYWKIAMTP